MEAIMKKLSATLALAIFGFTGAAVCCAQENPMVGGAAMYPSKDIVDNAVHSADHSTLVAAVKAAGLVDTLKGRAHSRFSRRPMKLSQSCLLGRRTLC
jgi:uncharacterized surface protein with fasciclin (FAS1) repeats